MSSIYKRSDKFCKKLIYIYFLTQRLAEFGRFKTTFTFKTAFTLDYAVGENRIVWCNVVLRVQQT